MVSPARATPVKVLVVDDHPLIRRSLTQLLRGRADLEVCGEAGDVTEAMRAAGRVRPDLAIVDLTLGVENGLRVVQQLRGQFPEVRIVVLSMLDEQVFAAEALQAGANGFVMKQTAAQNLFEAIKTVLAGRTYLSPQLRDRFPHLDGV